MWSKELQSQLQSYDTGQKESWLHWLLLGEYGYHQTAHIFMIHALHNTDVMKEEAWLCWLLLGEYGY